MKIFILLLLSLPFAGISQSVIIGTATQGYNKNAPKQVDAGAKAFVFKYEGDAIDLYEKINNFLTAKNYRLLNNDIGRQITIYKDSADVIKSKRNAKEQFEGFQNKIAAIKSAAAERTVKLQALNAETNPKFDALDQQSAKAVSQAKLRAADMRSVADAAGKFSIKVTPGKYAVLVVSNNRTGFSSTEVVGKISLTQTEIKEGETVNVSAHFIPD